LKECGYNRGLCRLLNTDFETGIVGDIADIKRRQSIFGKHQIALPKISSFYTLLSRNFEDSNVIFLTWAATLYLAISLFGKSGSVYIESLTIYSGLVFSALISSTCDWIKER
jgi:magnesium-transporting ATPase (P-type)